MTLPTATDVAVTIALGVAANLATDLIKAGMPRPTHTRLRSRIEPVRTLAWSLPITVLPLAALLLTRHRWVVTFGERIALLAATFVIACAIVWAHRYLSTRRPRQLPVAALLFTIGLVISMAILDDTLPRYVALACPTSPVAPTAQIVGRALPPASQVTVHYDRSGNRSQHSDSVRVQGGDGSWSAGLPFSAASGETWTVWATTLYGRSRTCRVVLK